MTAGSPANRAARCHHASVYPSPLLALHTALLQPRPPSFSLSIPTTPGDSHSSFHMPFSKPGIWYFLLLPADIYRKPDLGVGECRGSFNLLCPSVTYSGRHSTWLRHPASHSCCARRLLWGQGHRQLPHGPSLVRRQRTAGFRKWTLDQRRSGQGWCTDAPIQISNADSVAGSVCSPILIRTRRRSPAFPKPDSIWKETYQ